MPSLWNLLLNGCVSSSPCSSMSGVFFDLKLCIALSTFLYILKTLSADITIIRINAGNNIENQILPLFRNGLKVFHIAADYRGLDTGNTFIKDTVNLVHRKLIDNSIRDEITLIASGGIAMAEHVPKIIISGADLTAVDIPLLLALGGKLYKREDLPHILLPDNIDSIPEETKVQRIINLMGAWHSQILEVLGAMGIREIRRLRGETGRAIFFDDIDKNTFGKIFKNPIS